MRARIRTEFNGPRRILVAALTVIATAVMALALYYVVISPLARAASGSINFTAAGTRIDGFGFAEHFSRAALMHGQKGETAANQAKLIDLLYSREDGAGMSILRLGVIAENDGIAGNQETIEPVNPGSPTATPNYVWDGSDGSQVWLAQQGQTYGLNRFIEDSWSAPAFMKTNNSTSGGGQVCGMSGTTCASGNWTQAYANYLIQYAKFYQQAGIHITDIDFTNEPDENVSYDSMTLSSAQVVNYLPIFGSTVQAYTASSGLSLNIGCCDLASWTNENTYATAIQANAPATSYVNAWWGHTYSGNSNAITAGGKTSWMTEYAYQPSVAAWNGTWDTAPAASDAWTLADNIYTNLTSRNVNAYVTWYGVSSGQTQALIMIDNPGPSFTVSQRLYAMAAWSRNVRPGATRVPATSGNANLLVTAFHNTDGTKVINILNSAVTAQTATITLDASANNAYLMTYQTDSTHSLGYVTGVASLAGETLTVAQPEHALITIIFPVEVTPETSITKGGLLYSRVTGTYLSTITVKNTGTTAINGPLHVVYRNLPAGVTVANASGTRDAPYITIPGGAGLAPGASASFTVQFGNPGNVPISYTNSVFAGVY